MFPLAEVTCTSDSPALKVPSRQAATALACNPSYSGGREQEDHGSKPAQANNSQDYISKKKKTKQKTHHKKGLVEGPRYRP
jgi:hypothetical protein